MSPMNADLSRSLASLAGTVQDDALAERLTGRVGPMVRQIRRRRAARTAGVATVGVGAAAAVVLGGVQLAGRGGGAVGPSTAGWDPQVWGCGPAPEPFEADEPIALDADVDTAAVTGTDVTVWSRVLLTTGTPTDLVGVDGTAVVLLRDGVVVTPAGVPIEGADLTTPAGITLTLTSCVFPGQPLPPGVYEVLVTETVALGGNDVPVSGRWPIALGATLAEARELAATLDTPEPTPDPDASETSDPNDPARAAVDAVLAAARAGEVTAAFPACGSTVPTDPDPLLALDLVGVGPTEASPAGGFTATVRTVGGRSVIANAPTSGALVVLVRDGVVVGRGLWDPEDVDVLDLGPADVRDLPATGQPQVCSLAPTDTPGLRLPAGPYDAYGTLDVMLKEIQEADGTAVSRSDLVTVVSAPIPVQVG